jgi:hypothetical protein
METAVKKLNLNKKKAKLKQKLAILTDDDKLLEEARQEELSMKYQAMFFQSEDELDQIISSL